MQKVYFYIKRQSCTVMHWDSPAVYKWAALHDAVVLCSHCDCFIPKLLGCPAEPHFLWRGCDAVSGTALSGRLAGLYEFVFGDLVLLLDVAQ